MFGFSSLHLTSEHRRQPSPSGLAALVLSSLILFQCVTSLSAAQTYMGQVKANSPYSGATSQIVDEAGVLPAETLRRLKELSAASEYWTARQFVLVVKDRAEAADLRQYVGKMARQRKVGMSGKPGVLLLVSVQDRKAALWAGDSAQPVISPRWQEAIVNRVVIPNLVQGNTERGIVDGTRSVLMALETVYPVRVEVQEPASGSSWITLVLIAFFLVGMMGSGGWGMYGPGGAYGRW